MHFTQDKDGYTLEVAVPWAATAVQPVSGVKFLADAGVIYGDAGGGRNAARAMWSDRTPEVGVNNDIPTESRMHPNGWGAVQLECQVSAGAAGDSLHARLFPCSPRRRLRSPAAGSRLPR